MKVDFSKNNDGLIPAIIQHCESGQVLMLGYMNQEAFDLTQRDGKVTFYSRSKGRLWQKGESSGNVLDVHSISIDCDKDAILILARPAGPTCHTGSESCFGSDAEPSITFLHSLTNIISQRNQEKYTHPESYTASLFREGLNRMAQKVGEEGVETVIASLQSDRARFVSEVSDLFFHTLVLCEEKGVKLTEIVDELRNRNKGQTSRRRF